MYTLHLGFPKGPYRSCSLILCNIVSSCTGHVRVHTAVVNLYPSVPTSSHPDPALLWVSPMNSVAWSRCLLSLAFPRPTNPTQKVTQTIRPQVSRQQLHGRNWSSKQHVSQSIHLSNQHSGCMRATPRIGELTQGGWEG